MKLRRLLDTRVTVRWRLTLLYGAVFLAGGVALLGVTYSLFRNFAFQLPKPDGTPTATWVRMWSAMSAQRTIGLHRLQVYSVILLGVTALGSVVLGWLLAGRVLAPLRMMAATAERISESNLHERIAMPGPRDELRLLADTIDRLLGRLEAAFDAQRRFVANASHELRTPLALMRTTLDVAIAKPGGPPDKTRELDRELRVDLDDADRLLESFLTLARAQNGRVEEDDRVPLEPLITAALTARADEIAAKELPITTHLAAVEVTGSRTLLARMVENVIENAVAHSDPGSSIEVTLTPVAGRRAQSRLTVATSGPRLDDFAVAQLAQPFKRLRQDRTGSENGHGLGLSIVAAVAAAHDGDLDLQARAEGGLRVQITLPGAAPVATELVAAVP